jgi:uncharacterized protein (TIGR02996 family)
VRVFTLLVDGPQGTERFEIDTHPTWIGRDSANEVVLAHREVDRRHARLEMVADQQVVVDLRSNTGTYVNGERVRGRRVLVRDDTLRIGPYEIAILSALEAKLAPYRPADDTEATLLGDVVGGESASRTVYADWLEEQGDRERAELVRLDMVTGTVGPEADRAANRRRELSERSDVAWRTLVARPLIEGCLELEFQCPKDWGSLTPTSESDVRHCSACEMPVYYCVDVPQARLHAKRGECVALDLGARRLDNDLAEPFDERTCPRCDIDVGPAEHCPRCGSAVRRPAMRYMGRISLR